MAPSDDLLTRTQAVFSDAADRNLSREQARECVANVAGFFDVLSKWQRDAATSSSKTPEQSQRMFDREGTGLIPSANAQAEPISERRDEIL